MKSLVDHLSQYAAYHRDPHNIATHFVGIPLIVIAVVAAGVAAVLWRWFVRIHTRMQVALLETLDNHKEGSH